jgi:hypothetical protein
MRRIRKKYSFGTEDSQMINYKAVSQWLLKRVGQPWDQIYSELLGKIKGYGYGRIDLIKQCVKWTVIPRTFRDDDGTIYKPHGRMLGPGEFYVDPEGILRRVAKQKRKRKVPQAEQIIRIGDNEYLKRGESWYYVAKFKEKVVTKELVLDEQEKPVFIYDYMKNAKVPLTKETVTYKTNVHHYPIRNDDRVKLRKNGYL